MKKKLFLIISVCLCLAGFTACEKTDPKDVDYNGYTYEDLQNNCQSTVQTLEDMSDDDVQNYLQSKSDIAVNLVSSWESARPDLGAFEGFGEFTVTKSGKTLTAAQTVNYEKRPLVLTYVFTYRNMEVEGITVDLVYTTGEKMSKAGLNTVMCIATVFAVLILISFVIYGFRLISVVENKMKQDKNVKATSKDKVVEQIEKREEQQDDLELISVIAAAIAAATGTSTDDFVVRSIKRRR